MAQKITVAMGDGIGPEVMEATLAVFRAARVPLEYELVPMGRRVAEAGEPSGITTDARASVERTGILFKGPMETPKGGGYKSVNVTARKLWGTFANKRVYRKLRGVPLPIEIRGDLHLTMVRENIEDTYGAVEHMQTHDVAQCRRFITRPGSEQVHRYTFEMAARKGARRVTCAHKANIMKMTDGLFLQAFYDVAKDYPHIRADDVIVDALAMRLVLDPTEFDVIVLPNLQGDILTDLAAGLVGGLAYAPSANIGDGICIFEAVHGTAPDIVGRNLANPTALLLSGTMMLRHLGLERHAAAIESALERTLDKMHTRPDLGQPFPVFQTSRFVELMQEALAETPAIEGEPSKPLVPLRQDPKMLVTPTPERNHLLGVDVFLESGLAPRAVAELLAPLEDDGLKLTMISNRGTQVWPTGSAHTDCVNHYRARFESTRPVEQRALIALLGRVADVFPLCSSEWLREIGGMRGYSLAQGQG
ncbi:MAG: isocitrate dehydrogenase [Sandaracinus sp.]|nr:isocitrate dehydrogenase [Sandaracinus sp.]MCB9612216.1 isocitrate dehydrogenase [Sandaracinus sp.]